MLDDQIGVWWYNSDYRHLDYEVGDVFLQKGAEGEIFWHSDSPVPFDAVPDIVRQLGYRLVSEWTNASTGNIATVEKVDMSNVAYVERIARAHAAVVVGNARVTGASR